MRQIAANRRNARKSTGPRTLSGKLRSRRNALRHGLTGETVIDVFEDASEYQAFERRMIRDYSPRSAIEHELVLRLTSLLWRLRRATAIETGLFSIQGRIMLDRKIQRDREEIARIGSKARLYEILGIAPNANDFDTNRITQSDQRMPTVANNALQNIAQVPDKTNLPTPSNDQSALCPSDPQKTPPQFLAQCFLRVVRLDDNILERISRYEVSLWRQVAQVVAVLTDKRRTKHTIK